MFQDLKHWRNPCFYLLAFANTLIHKLLSKFSILGVFSPAVHVAGKYRRHFGTVVNKNCRWTQGFERHICSIPFALTARQIDGQLAPRALLWAICLLGFQPVFAVCQFPTMKGNGLNVIAQQPMCRALAGRSPNRIIAQGIRPGLEVISLWARCKRNRRY